MRKELRYDCNQTGGCKSKYKKYFDMVFNGEPVIVSRKENKNVVIISEAEYSELAKTNKNTEYLAKLNKADDGKTRVLG